MDKLYLYGGIVLLGTLVAFGLHHMGAESQWAHDKPIIDGLNHDRSVAVDANAAQLVTQDALQKSLAACTALVTTQKQASDVAIAAQKAATTSAQTDYKAASATLSTLLSGGDCKLWASQPACTVDLPFQIPPKKGH